MIVLNDLFESSRPARIAIALALATFASGIAGLPLRANDSPALPGTAPLTVSGDLSAQMVAGIDAFLTRELERSITNRLQYWDRDFASRAAYDRSVEPNRIRLRRIIGAADTRLPVRELEYESGTSGASKIAETEAFTVHVVRWQVFEGVYGEGLLLNPKGLVKARVIALPDADQLPELLIGLARGLPPELQFARRLAESGCQVAVPVLINRMDNWSGNAMVGRFTNQPHREWIYRQAFEMGRHIIGYEVAKVLGMVDWFKNDELEHPQASGRALPVGVVGYGEGGLIALYAAAVDTRIDAAVISGYFESRQNLWAEPIYRNVFGLLAEFGDAELATLIAPRKLIVEHAEAPVINGPPKPGFGRTGAAPGRITTPAFASVQGEFNRARALLDDKFADALRLIHQDGQPVGPVGDATLGAFAAALGLSGELPARPGAAPVDLRKNFRSDLRQQRQVKQLQDHVQRLLAFSDSVRNDRFWSKVPLSTPDAWRKACDFHREYFWEEVIGRFPPASLPANARSRELQQTDRWTAYEVMLDVWPDVFAWGYLLLPKDLKPGERRPVVVCQHGLEGLPEDTINANPAARPYAAYKAFAARLAERGFITFAPHNPYRGGDAFRVLQRKANPLKKSLFSVIIAQHDRILDWLSQQPFVDPTRIGFYGLSYGGKTAMRVPAVLDRYALSICSGDFNDWIKKNVTVDSKYSYLFTGEYEMPEWNLGHTYNYAEMAALIAPRPFMVERGHKDGVAPDEWVAHEFSAVRRIYTELGISGNAAIEFFDGPHTINGVGTFEFLHKHLNWPAK
jgi:dienelactone hydrolase